MTRSRFDATPDVLQELWMSVCMKFKRRTAITVFQANCISLKRVSPLLAQQHPYPPTFTLSHTHTVSLTQKHTHTRSLNWPRPELNWTERTRRISRVLITVATYLLNFWNWGLPKTVEFCPLEKKNVQEDIFRMGTNFWKSIFIACGKEVF